MRMFLVLWTMLVGLMSAPAMAQGPVPPIKAPTAAAAVAPPAGTSATLDRADLEAWLDGFMPYALSRGHVAGAVVVVVNREGTVLQKGYGYADIATRRPVSPETTLFRPGSVSKLVTWTAVMQQVEAGKLDLDKDVNTYLDFKIPPFEGKPITLRQIMTHTAGFEESIRYLMSNDPAAAVPLARHVKVALPVRVFAPGTTPAYSNYATALAGYIVERVSGMSFDDYLDARVFKPLGMTRSTFRQPLPAGLRPLMSSGYASSTEPARPLEVVPPSPAGALSSPGADMGKFMIAHLNQGGALLKPATAAQMHDFRAPGLGPLNTMALGFYEQWVNGRRAIAHGGDTTVFHSYLWLFPEDGLGVYISMNSGGKEGAAGAIRSALFHGFADRYLPGPDPVGSGVDAATAKQHAALLAGNYTSSRGAFTNFISLMGLFGQAKVTVGEDGKIRFPALDGLSAGPRDWTEISPFVWRDHATGERLAAEVVDGRVVRMSIDAASPFMVFMPASFGENAAWLVPALVAALVIVLLTVVLWPVRALVRRNFKAVETMRGGSMFAWRASRMFAVLVLVAVGGWVGLVMAFSADIGSVGGPMDWLIRSVRALTPIAAIGLLVTGFWHLSRSWADRRGWGTRLGAVLLVASALVLCWVTWRYNLYGFNMVF